MPSLVEHDPVEAMLTMLRQTSDLAEKYRRIGSLNEQFCSGAQWGAIALTGTSQPTLVDDDWLTGLPRIWSNRTAGLLQSWAALLSGDSPTGTARPASRDPLDAYRAEISNAILQYLRQKLQTAEKISQVVRYAGQHGTAGIRISFDVEAEELQWDTLTIYQYQRDPTADYRDSKWVIFRSWISKADATKRLRDIGVETEPALEKRTNSLGEQIEGVELQELYEKPSEEMPEGRYAATICGECVQHIANPFYFNIKGKKVYILPFFLMKVRDQRDSPYGATPVTDLIPLQRSMNEALAVLMLRMRLGQPSLILPRELAANYNPLTSASITFDVAQKDLVPLIRWTDPPKPDPHLDRLLSILTNEMMSVIGLNDTSAGSAQRAQSGAAIDSLLALDKQKNADTSTSMKGMIIEAFRFSLLVVAALYSDEKKAEIAAQTQAAVDIFDESDIGGVDVALQIDSENNDRNLGSQRTADSGLAMQQARQLVQAFVAGSDVLNSPEELAGTDAASLKDAINEAKAEALAAGDSTLWQALFQLQARVDVMAPAAPAPGAKPMPAQPPSGTPNPDATNPDAVVDGPPHAAMN